MTSNENSFLWLNILYHLASGQQIIITAIHDAWGKKESKHVNDYGARTNFNDDYIEKDNQDSNYVIVLVVNDVLFFRRTYILVMHYRSIS